MSVVPLAGGFRLELEQSSGHDSDEKRPKSGAKKPVIPAI
jgi:hypothetical protein